MSRAEDIQGVCHYLVDGIERYKIQYAGLRMGTISRPQDAVPSPSLKNLTVDKKITRCKPKICSMMKDTGETTLQCTHKTFNSVVYQHFT